MLSRASPLFVAARAAGTVAGRRGLAGAAEHVQLPAKVYGISGRYANALYVTAFKNKALEKVQEELAAFKEAMNTNDNLRRYCVDPSVSRKAKADTFASILKDNSEVTRKFVGVLCENGRMSEIEAVMGDFIKLMNASKKEVQASVTTTVPLEAAKVTAIKEALKGFVAKDETINLECKIDPEILGGMVVSVGDRRIDLSITRSIDELRREIEAPVR